MPSKQKKEKVFSKISHTKKDKKFFENNIKHLEPILGSIREAVVIVDETGVVVLANSATEFITGVVPSDLVGHHVQKAIAFECEKINFSWFLSEALSGSRAVKLPEGCFVVGRGGEKTPITATGVPFYSPNGDFVGVVLTIHDLTEEVRARNREYEFLSYISHQIRQPLALFRWTLEAIFMEKEKLDPRHEDMLRDLYSASNRFKGFINDLMDISRLQIGKIKFKIQKVHIREIVESVATEAKDVLATHNVTLRIFPEARVTESFTIDGDPDRLHDVFSNLIVNAILYNRPQGTVVVDARFEEEETVERLALKSRGSEKIPEYFQSMPIEGSTKKRFLLVSITDTGLGIPEEQQEKAFSSFFRGDNVVRKGISGTGLGLFISKSIIEGLGGKVFFQSKKDVGTTFYAIFPAFA